MGLQNMININFEKPYIFNSSETYNINLKLFIIDISVILYHSVWMF